MARTLADIQQALITGLQAAHAAVPVGPTVDPRIGDGTNCIVVSLLPGRVTDETLHQASALVECWGPPSLALDVWATLAAVEGTEFGGVWMACEPDTPSNYPDAETGHPKSQFTVHVHTHTT